MITRHIIHNYTDLNHPEIAIFIYLLFFHFLGSTDGQCVSECGCSWCAVVRSLHYFVFNIDVIINNICRLLTNLTDCGSDYLLINVNYGGR